MIGFFIGLLIGGVFGVCIMAICNVASNEDAILEKLSKKDGE